jgi:hypothetical protein
VNYPYNDAVTSLRRNEYVYLASIQRYWDKLTTEQYETFFADVRSVDRAFHAFNDEFGAVDEGTKQKVDPAKTKELAPAVAAAVAKLEQSSTILLTSLSKR